MDGLMSAEEASRASAGFLPPPRPLPMAPARLTKVVARVAGSRASGRGLAPRRLFIFASTIALTAGGVYEMYKVVNVVGVTALEWVLLALFVVLFAWVAFSFVSALAGAFALIAGGAGLHIDDKCPVPTLNSRVAMLLPTYNENPHPLFARWRSMLESARACGADSHFDWFMLSDTTDPDIWIAEEAAFRDLRAGWGERVFYRHRAENLARKSGNIADWIERFGAGYDFMIILDADSLMSGDTIARLAAAMEAHDDAALIQTAPIVINARSLFSRLQQFAGRVYGPMVIAGNAWWQGPDGNYWGHNAIIRLRAFADEAALPVLRGDKPFGGHILSHDFIEAAFMRRANWAIYAAPSLGGSYEEAPPSLIDFAARDRRWCQGNLQHIALLPTRGLRWLSRLHLLVGIGAYVTAPLWFIFLMVGLLISLQAEFLRPEYFPKGFALFPTWPRQDPVLAAWVFGGTMGMLLLPKLMAYFAGLARAERAALRRPLRTFGGVLAEIVIAALVAPSMMVLQSTAVVEIFFGRDSGWKTQRRDGEVPPLSEVTRALTAPTLLGLVIGVAAYAISWPLLLWMSPVVVGLVLSIPLGVLTSWRPRGPGLFATPEDVEPPLVVARAAEIGAEPATPVTHAMRRLREDRDLLEIHLSTLTPRPLVKSGKIDVPLATARAKLAASEDFVGISAWLDKAEVRAALNDADTLIALSRMP